MNKQNSENKNKQKGGGLGGGGEEGGGRRSYRSVGGKTKRKKAGLGHIFHFASFPLWVFRPKVRAVESETAPSSLLRAYAIVILTPTPSPSPAPRRSQTLVNGSR